MSISLTEARNRYTNTLIGFYQQLTTPTGFLRSDFADEVSTTKYVSFDVQRFGEQVAVDVQRGTEGNTNTFDENMNKLFLPPYYREKFHATSMDLYDRALGSPLIDEGVYAQLVQETAKRMKHLQNKIDRAAELQCAQVKEFGIVTLKDGTIINFKRRGEMMSVLGDGNWWASAGVDPYKTIEGSAKRLRQIGKMEGGGTVNVLCGEDAWTDFMNNDVVKQRNDIKVWKLDDIVPPARGVVGGVYHGTVTCGSYTAHMWTYPEFYDHPTTGVSTPYWNPKKICVTPYHKPKFVLAYGAVPRLLMGKQPVASLGTTTDVMGKYVIGDYTDSRIDSHIFDIKSAFVAIPMAVDQMDTVQVCPDA